MPLRDMIQRRAKAINDNQDYGMEEFGVSDYLNDLFKDEELRLATSHLFANENPQEMMVKFVRRVAELAEDGVQQQSDREIFRNMWRVLQQVVIEDFQTAEVDAEAKPHHARARQLKGDLESLMIAMGIDVPPMRGQGSGPEGRSR